MNDDDDYFMPEFFHLCPDVGGFIDQFCTEFLDCRCATSPEFLEAQDKLAVALDLERK